MERSGFQYIPVDPGPGGLNLFAPTPLERMTTAELVATYGFGISTQLFEQSQLPEGLVGRPAAPSAASLPDDPNEEYLSTLNSAQQVAYQTALTGDDGEGGCFAEVAAVLRVEFPESELTADLATAFDDVRALVMADESVLEARERVAECLTERGFSVASNAPIEASIQARVSSLQARAEPPLSDSDALNLRMIQDDEIALAKAALECGYFDEYSAIVTRRRYAIEQEYVDSHPELFVD